MSSACVNIGFIVPLRHFMLCNCISILMAVGTYCSVIMLIGRFGHHSARLALSTQSSRCSVGSVMMLVGWLGWPSLHVTRSARSCCLFSPIVILLGRLDHHLARLARLSYSSISSFIHDQVFGASYNGSTGPVWISRFIARFIVSGRIHHH